MPSNQPKNHDAPFFTFVMIIIALIAIPFVILIVFTVWPESTARQLAVAGVMLSLLGLVVFRNKYEALLLASIFFTQFGVSLYSFAMNPPVRFQILFGDIILIAFLAVAIENKTEIKSDILGNIFIVMIMWFIVTTFASAHLHRSILFVVNQIKFLTLYILALNFRMNDKLIGRVFHVVLAVVIIQSVIAVAQILKGGPLGLHILGEFSGENLKDLLVQGNLRVAGTIGGTNGFAGYMAMMMVFMFPFLINRNSMAIYIIFSMGLISLMLALSRAGWVSLIIGALCSLIMMLRLKVIRIRYILRFIIIIGVVSVIGVSLYYDNIMHRFQDREAIHSALGRLSQIHDAFEVIGRFPVFGIGPGVSEFFGRWNDNQKYIRESLPNVKLLNQVHSSQLQIAIESGLPGLFLFLLLSVALGVGVLRRHNIEMSSDHQKLLYIAGTCSAIAVFVHISFGTEFNSRQIFTALWILLGLSRCRNYTNDEV